MEENKPTLNIERANQLFDMDVRENRVTEDFRDKFIRGMQNPDNALQYFDALVKEGRMDDSMRGKYLKGLFPGMFDNAPYASAPAQSSITDQFDAVRNAGKYQKEAQEKQEAESQRQLAFQQDANKRMQGNIAFGNLGNVKLDTPKAEIDGNRGVEKALQNHLVETPTIQERLYLNELEEAGIDKELNSNLDNRATKEEFEQYMKNPKAYQEKYRQGLLSKESVERNARLADLQKQKKALQEDTRKLMAEDFKYRLDELEIQRMAAKIKAGVYEVDDESGAVIDRDNPAYTQEGYVYRKMFPSKRVLDKARELAANMNEKEAKDLSDNDNLLELSVRNIQKALRLSQLDNDASGWSKFWSSVKTTWDGGRVLPYINTLELADLFAYRKALQRLEKGEATEADKELVVSQLDKDTADQLYNEGFAGRLAASLIESLSFMADMAIGGRVGSFIKVGKPLAKKLMSKGIGKEVIRGSERMAAQTVTLPFSTAPYMDVERRQIGNYHTGYDNFGNVYAQKSENAEGVGTSLMNAYVKNLISRQVETVVGPLAESGAKWLVTAGGRIKWTKDVIDKISRFNEKAQQGLKGEILDALNMQSFVGEMTEEIAEEPLQRLLVGMSAVEKDYAEANGTNRWSGLYDKEFWTQTAASIGLMQVLFRLPGIAVKGNEAAQNAANMRNGLSKLSDAQKLRLRSIMQMEDDNQRAAALSELMNNTTEDQRNGILQYTIGRIAQNMYTGYTRAAAQQKETEAYRQTLMAATVGNELWVTTDRNGQWFAYKFNPDSYDSMCIAYPIEGEAENGTLQIGKPRQMSMDNLDIRNAQKYPVETLLQDLAKRQEQQNEAQDAATEQQEQQATRPDADARRTYIAGHDFEYTDTNDKLRMVSQGSRIVPTSSVPAGTDPDTPVNVSITKPNSSVAVPGVMTLSEFQERVESGYMAAEELSEADTAADVRTDSEGNPVEEEAAQEETPAEGWLGRETEKAEERAQNAPLNEEETGEQTEKENVEKADNGADNTSGLIGRSATEEEATAILSQMEAGAEVAPEVELTPENWVAQFGEDGKVETPIGTVKMGEGQYLKLAKQGRNGKLGMIRPTLESPDIIIEDKSKAKDGQEVSVSSQEKETGRIKRLIKDGRLAYIKKATLPLESGSSIQGNQSAIQTGANLSTDKDTQSSEEKQVRLPEESEVRIVPDSEFDVNDMDTDNYVYVVHQTSDGNGESIARTGFRTGSGLNGTASFANRETVAELLENMRNGHGHKGSTSLVIMKFPKSVFQTGDKLMLDDISFRLSDMGNEFGLVPTQYIDQVVRVDRNGNQPGQTETAVSETENAEPIGKNRFGNIYQWTKGKAAEAVNLLRRLREGYVKGVFSRPDIGEIDLAWGNDGGGLKHIIQKHIVEHDDFDSIEDAVKTIEEVVTNGNVSRQGSNISLDYGNYRVSLAQSEEGTWVLTSFDKTKSLKEKRRNDSDTTLGDQSVADGENGALVSPEITSARDKDTQSSEEKQIQLPENPVQKQYEALLADSEDEADAVDTAQQMVANTQAELDKARKATTKGKTVEAIQEAKRAKRERIAALEKDLKFWQDVAGYPEARRRQEETQRQLQKKMDARQRAEERRRKNGGLQLRLTDRDKALGDPLSVEEYVLRRIATGATKFLWNGTSEGTGGLKEHGGGNRYRLQYVDTNRGKVPEVVADDMVYDINENHPELGNVTASEILDIIEGIGVGEQGFSELMERAEELHNSNGYEAQAQAEVEEAEREERANDEAAQERARESVENLSDEEYREAIRPRFVGEMFNEDGTPRNFRERGSRVQAKAERAEETEKGIPV
ncbi:MAG: hypothetical protein NC324_08700, partial [Bacteroides sp.]|nr:hypothetical protein [Bacteroides sp.]